jgi:hypothetical protein
MPCPEAGSRFFWTARFCRTVVVLSLLPLAVPLCCWAQDEPPKLLSTTGGTGRQPWKNLADVKKAAAAGIPGACMQLGLCYETGEAVKQDYAQAIALYEQAAAGGVADAIYRLGKLHQDGLGVEPDPIHARELYQIAAEANVPLAQYNLGAMLVSARGGKRDVVEGLAWLILARRNHIDADGEQQVRSHLPPPVIAAAEKRAEELTQAIASRKDAKPKWPPSDPESSPSMPVTPVPPAVKRALTPPLAPLKIEVPPPPAYVPPSIPAPTEPKSGSRSQGNS